MADCYSKSFVEKAQESADLIGCDLGYAVGSNHLLEKCFKATGTHNFWLRSRDIRLLTKISLNKEWEDSNGTTFIGGDSAGSEVLRI